jgi:hypothetical protein
MLSTRPTGFDSSCGHFHIDHALNDGAHQFNRVFGTPATEVAE